MNFSDKAFVSLVWFLKFVVCFSPNWTTLYFSLQFFSQALIYSLIIKCCYPFICIFLPTVSVSVCSIYQSLSLSVFVTPSWSGGFHALLPPSGKASVQIYPGCLVAASVLSGPRSAWKHQVLPLLGRMLDTIQWRGRGWMWCGHSSCECGKREMFFIRFRRYSNKHKQQHMVRF